MRRFTDSKDRAWTLDFSVGVFARVKSLSDNRFDLWQPDKQFSTDPTDKPVSLQANLLIDLSLLAEVLWLVICHQAEAADVDAEKFAEALSPVSILAARDAFFGEWRDFFQNLQRPDQAMSLEKTLAWMKAAEQKLAVAVTDQRVTNLDRKVRLEMDQAMNDSLGKLPASSE